MPADIHHKVYVLPKFSSRDYYSLMRCFANLEGFEENDVAKFRLMVLKHTFEFGWKAAVAAYAVPKSTLFDWKRVYEKSNRRLSSLVPKSTRPHRTRLARFDPRLVELVKTIRQEYGSISKYKLKLFLDEYARELGVPNYGHSKIGKLIKRHGYFFTSHKRKQSKSRLLLPRLKRCPVQSSPGYIEMDSVVIYIFSHRYYFVTVIDIMTKFAWVKLTTSLSSKAARLAMEEFKSRYNYSIREVQTDNGHEFLGEFDRYLTSERIPHQFSYPRSPKVNGVVERFNRTLQDEFINQTNSLYQEIEVLNAHLLKYLSWYNTKRPHYSLKYLTPIQYLNQFHSEK